MGPILPMRPTPKRKSDSPTPVPKKVSPDNQLLDESLVVDGRTLQPFQQTIIDLMNDPRSRVAYLARDMVQFYFLQRYFCYQPFLGTLPHLTAFKEYHIPTVSARYAKFVGTIAGDWMCFVVCSRANSTRAGYSQFVCISEKTGDHTICAQSLPCDVAGSLNLVRVFLDRNAVPTFVALDLVNRRAIWAHVQLADRRVSFSNFATLYLESSLSSNSFLCTLLRCESVVVPDPLRGIVASYSFKQASTSAGIAVPPAIHQYDTCDPHGLVCADGGRFFLRSPSDRFIGTAVSVPRINCTTCHNKPGAICKDDHMVGDRRATRGDLFALSPDGQIVVWINEEYQMLYIAQVCTSKLLASRCLVRRPHAPPKNQLYVVPFFCSSSKICVLSTPIDGVCGIWCIETFTFQAPKQ